MSKFPEIVVCPLLFLKGGNPYENMRAALARVGITATGRQDYQSGFGLTLAPRQVEEINKGSAHLLAADEALIETPEPDLTAAQEERLWTQAEPLFAQLKQSYEETIMWIPDIRPDAGLLLGAMAAVAAASPAQAADNYVLGVCRTASFDSGAEIRPEVNGDMYLGDYYGDDPRYKKTLSSGPFFADSKVTLIKTPARGEVALVDTPLGMSSNWYHYMPNAGYSGRDRFVIQVEKGGVRVRIHYLMEVLDEYDTPAGRCARGHWKINSITPNNTSLAALLTNTTQTFTGFTNIEGIALAQTTGTGPSATITLDTDAAGHGWFIDTTPYLNEEYLPTSNPNEWVAKEGSDAAGKMDLLTVLQHEYLHTAGFDHSSEPGNIMSATLQPGMRRTLTVDQQLALMRLAGYFPVPETPPSSPYAPRDPGAPLPYTRSSATGTPARRRVVDYLGLNAEQLVSQFETAANPTLTNPAFTGNTGWSTTGPIGFANNTATLTESATAQTRLNQVFVVGPNDRFLSFTLANIGLDNPSTRSGQLKATAPDDAFEVALLDANTGASLLAGTGLTKSDAILNLQANGTERKASGLTSVLNPDGSRTYLVDLSGIAAGTVANLSFDLIGFGRGAAATSSHVTVRDLHLGLPLEARNDVGG